MKKDWRKIYRPYYIAEGFVTVLNKVDNSVTIYKMKRNLLESYQLKPEKILEHLGCNISECEFMVSLTKPFCSNMTDLSFEFSNDLKQ